MKVLTASLLAAATALAAFAAPAGAITLGQPATVSDGKIVIPVAGGCGRGWHRNRWGHCVRGW